MLPLLLLPFLASVNAQCGDALDSSQALAHATSIADLFPVPLTTAKIVSGDSEAQKIYDAILANETYKSALAIAPKTETMEYPATDPVTCHCRDELHLNLLS
ncbi:hypothetical protein BT69DRAFT_141337 [Atractiella rhizophila]|nr:hypothetical protein BT69DRAFT_141337 [Atractiella rhizophila]